MNDIKENYFRLNWKAIVWKFLIKNVYIYVIIRIYILISLSTGISNSLTYLLAQFSPPIPPPPYFAQQQLLKENFDKNKWIASFETINPHVSPHFSFFSISDDYLEWNPPPTSGFSFLQLCTDDLITDNAILLILWFFFAIKNLYLWCTVFYLRL